MANSKSSKTPTTRLIVSFIGETDLKYLGNNPNDDEQSPIKRLLRYMNEQGYNKNNGGNNRLILFNDFKSDKAEEIKKRQDFFEQLKALLPGMGLNQLSLELIDILTPEGPTNLKRLYELVSANIPRSGPKCTDEVFFNLSSGTPAMKFTLLLASQALPLKVARVFESSREDAKPNTTNEPDPTKKPSTGVKEVEIPYVLAMRASRSRTTDLRLNDPARRNTLLTDNTVIGDPQVEELYARLSKFAEKKSPIPRLIISGASGSGKWHACRKFAAWRNKPTIECHSPETLPDSQHIDTGSTLLIWRLDTWPEDAVANLASLSKQRSDIAIAASFRKGLLQASSDDMPQTFGLNGAQTLDLPALDDRIDVYDLSLALAYREGIPDGKIKERLNYYFLTDHYPRNLHDLQTFLKAAYLLRPGHPELATYQQATNEADAVALLQEAWLIIAEMDFGADRHQLKDVLDVIQFAVITLAEQRFGSQTNAAAKIGYKQNTISGVLKNRPDLTRWRTKLVNPIADD